jgi:hypothetical protein
VEQNYLDEAQDIYKEEVGEPFSFYACWLYLKNHPKWAAGETSIRSIVAASVDLTGEEATPALANSSMVESLSSFAQRPQGQKAAKAERKKDQASESFEAINAQSMRLRATAHDDAVTFNIMSKLGMDNPIAREWFERKARAKLEALKQIEEEQAKEQAKQESQAKKEKQEKEAAQEKLIGTVAVVLLVLLRLLL